MLILFLMCIAHIVYSEGRTTRVYDITNEHIALPQNIYSRNKNDLNKSEIIETTTDNETVIKNANSNSETLEKADKEELKVSFSDNDTELIRQLIHAVEKVNANLATYNKSFRRIARKFRRHNSRDSLFDMIPPLARHRRSINNVSETESNTIDVNTKINSDNSTQFTTIANTEKSENETVSDEWLVNSNDTGGNLTEIFNGRRSFNSDMQIANVLRSRLLSYVHDNINDTMHKIDSLKNVKNSYANNNAFNIGYIMANIDLIDINMNKLRDGIKKNHHVWAESHILDVYDKVKYTNDVITGLLNALKMIFNHQPNVNEYIYRK